MNVPNAGGKGKCLTSEKRMVSLIHVELGLDLVISQKYLQQNWHEIE
jgi:hypothetical protein